jgi:membrane carboxypeptidase/penicillin-binding protein
MAYLKIVGKAMLGLCLAIVVYLTIVAIWASLSVAYLLPMVTEGGESSLLKTEQKTILLKIEDPTFYDHIGIDASQGQGLTTITSSLARDVFLFGGRQVGIKGGFQTFYRAVFNCCKKVDIGRDIMALVLDHNLSKQQQLRLFVSSTYMGGNNGEQLLGLPAAASRYFGKTLPNLSSQEFISLVAMLKAPNYYHPSKGVLELKARISRIEKIVYGECQPSGWFDTSYEHCLATGSDL